MPFPVAFSGAASATFLPTTGGFGAGGAALFTGAAIKSPAAFLLRRGGGADAGRRYCAVRSCQNHFPFGEVAAYPVRPGGRIHNLFPGGLHTHQLQLPRPGANIHLFAP